MARGAVAPPEDLFNNNGGYQPPGAAPSTLNVLADRIDQATPNIIFIPNTDVAIPIPSARQAVDETREFVEDPLEYLKQMRLWGGN